MLKMYHRHTEAGGSAAYWEEFGRDAALADLVRFLDVDPLRPLFQRYLKTGATMLEGGCGRGQYVAYYASKGVNVIGLDFARDWLSAIHREAPALKLCAGDVGALPFPSGTFDLYYSGGVVEHFEGGPGRALAEARRVIKDDGILLVSVPYFSPMRRALALAGRDEWRRVEAPRVDDGGSGGKTFYQYAFTIPEFTRHLEAAGFRVVSTQGYALLWGLTELGLLARMLEAAQRRRGEGPAARRGGPAEGGPYARPVDDHAVEDRPVDANNGRGRAPSLLKRLLVAEDTSIAVAGWLVRLGRWAHANMMMFVCTPA